MGTNGSQVRMHISPKFCLSLIEIRLRNIIVAPFTTAQVLFAFGDDSRDSIALALNEHLLRHFEISSAEKTGTHFPWDIMICNTVNVWAAGVETVECTFRGREMDVWASAVGWEKLGIRTIGIFIAAICCL